MKRNSVAALLVLALLGPGGCGESSDAVFQGYVEAEYVYLASPRAGRLDKLHVERGSAVEAGALLFELEAEYERRALGQAEQELAAAEALLGDMETGRRPEEVAMAEAQLGRARAEAEAAAALLRRREGMIKSGGVSKQELDDSRAASLAATARVAELARQVEVYNLPERDKRIEAQRATAKAAGERAAQARWDLDQKRLSAPAAGLVYDTLFRQGEWVGAGSPVVQMLPPGNVKIRFFVPETLLGGVRLGGRALVYVDGRAEPFPAAVSYVAPNAEYTPPVIYSNETRSKLVFMVEARPAAETAATLHPGQPAGVSLP